MSLGEERELVPLGAGFDVAKRGYSRAQVDEHLERLDSDLKMLTADRDAAIAQAGDLARQLEISRGEIADLRGQVDRLAQPPTSVEGLSERLQRMLRLAQDESADTRARAEAEAGHIRAKAETDASAMRARYEQLLTELDLRRKEMEAEHRKVLEDARAEAKGITDQAEAERKRLDVESAERRTKIEEDFEIAMASRRSDAMRVLAEQEAASKAEAARRVQEATQDAADIRAKVLEEETTATAERERRHRESVADANKRKQDSINESNARLAEAADEARRRVTTATDESNRRITQANERVDALRKVRVGLAEQVRSARAVLAEAHHVLGDDPKVPAEIKAEIDGTDQTGKTDPAGVTEDIETTIRVTDAEETVRLRAADVPRAKPSPPAERSAESDWRVTFLPTRAGTTCAVLPDRLSSLLTRDHVEVLRMGAAYRTVVVGTDGSESSFAAVDRAAAVAADAGATLVITCAYYPAAKSDVDKAQDVLGEEAYQVVGSAPAEDTLQSARDRAVRVGAGKIDTVAVKGDPVDSLRKVVAEREADLLVVGNRGLNTIAGRILGSVPSEVARKSGVDVLIVHTT